VRDALKSYLALAGGVTEVTRQRALEAAKALVASGEAAAEQVTSLAEDLLSQTRQNPRPSRRW
jgi:polyhydroxyalkanoate synthesis regulator phasin